MAIRDKITAINARKLCFGERLHHAEDGTLKPASKAGKGAAPSNGYEREYLLEPGAPVKRGTWPDFDPINLSDLKNGMEVKLCGIKTEDSEGRPLTPPTVREVLVDGKASSRVRSVELKAREDARAQRQGSAKAPKGK